jgi:hypothetical protein
LSLLPYGSSAPQRREANALARARTQINNRTDLAIYQSQAQLELSQAKGDVLTVVTGHAMKGAAQLYQLVGQLVETVPGCGPEVSLIMTRGVWALDDLITSTAGALRQVRL